jgi:MFS family permease
MADGARGLGRDFWLYFTGQTISQLGTSFTLFVLPLLVFRLTHSATNLAITTAAEFVPYLLFGLVLGAVVDRVQRKPMMVLVDTARAAVVSTIPLLYVAGALEVQYVYAVGFVQATLGILFDAGEFTAIPSLVGRDDLVAANGRIMATNNLGQVLGPVIAGAAVTVLAVPYLLFVDAASFLVSAAFLLAIRSSFNEPRSEAAAHNRPERSLVGGLVFDIREGLGYVWRHPVLRSISIMMALINFFGSTAYTQLVLFAKDTFSASDQQVSFFFAAGSLGVVVVGMSAAAIRRRLSFAVTALGALVVSGLATTGMALVGNYWAAVVLWAVACGFGLLLNINTGALRQAIVPSHLFGRVISIAGVLAWSAIPLGALTGAAVIKATGNVAAVYAGIGIITALIALGFGLSPLAQGDRYLADAAAADTTAVPPAEMIDGVGSLVLAEELEPGPGP